MRTELRHPLLPHVNKEDVLRYFTNFPAYFEAVKSRFYSSSTNSGLKWQLMIDRLLCHVFLDYESKADVSKPSCVPKISQSTH